MEKRARFSIVPPHYSEEVTQEVNVVPSPGLVEYDRETREMEDFNKRLQQLWQPVLSRLQPQQTEVMRGILRLETDEIIAERTGLSLEVVLDTIVGIEHQLGVVIPPRVHEEISE
jgi:hypothetical protein